MRSNESDSADGKADVKLIPFEGEDDFGRKTTNTPPDGAKMYSDLIPQLELDAPVASFSPL